MKDTHINSPKKILVTGVAGFIGSHVARFYLSQKNPPAVIGIDNLTNYYSPKIKQRRVDELSQNENFVLFRESILNRKVLTTIVKKHAPSMLIHTAGEVGVRNGELNPNKYLETNVIGTQMLLQSLAPTLKHAVLLSSSSVYGDTKPPQKETAPIIASTPKSVYGASKAMMEFVCHNFYTQHNIPTTIIRPFSVYGPDGRPDMLPIRLLIAAVQKKTLPITGLKNNSRDWSYIDEVTQAITQIASKPNGFQIVNVGTGRSCSLQKTITVARDIIQSHGYSLHVTDAPSNQIEVSKTKADTAKLKKIYQINMATTFEHGFKKTAEFFFTHKELYI